jgi:hypothetical protein
MAFTNTIARYASFGTIQSIPGEVIDSFGTSLTTTSKVFSFWKIRLTLN